MSRRPRLTRRLLAESHTLGRAAAHLLSALRDRHPRSDDLRIALRAVLEFEAGVRVDLDRLEAPGPGPSAEAAP